MEKETDDMGSALDLRVIVSHMLEVGKRWRLASAKPKTARNLGVFYSAQVAILGALFS